MEERFLDSHLIRDLELRLGVSDIFSWIDNEGQHLAEYGMCSHGCVEFNDKLKKECNISNIKMIPNGIIGEDACIIPKDEQYQILYKKGLPSNRMRFAIAHEIGHTYWFRNSGNTFYISPLQTTIRHNSSIEYLCDRFAAALLLPKKDIIKWLEINNILNDMSIPPLHIVQAIAKRYRVADQAVARRLFYHLFPRKIALLAIKKNIVIQSLLEDEEDDNPKWRVVWCALPADIQQCELSSDIKIPLRTSGRIIPDEMIPDVSEGITSICDLDSRWWYGISGQLKVNSRVAFKKIPYMGNKEGYACISGNIIYIALPL